MGSPCRILLFGGPEGDFDIAIEAAISEVRRIEAKYSLFSPSSYLSELNRIAAAGGSVRVDDETANMFDVAFDAFRRSDGLFDITAGLLKAVWNDERRDAPHAKDLAPVLFRIGLDKVRWKRPEIQFLSDGMRLDLGGLGKEYAADQAADLLSAHGIIGGLIDLGGDIRSFGNQTDHLPWRIGVRDPNAPDESLFTIFMQQGGVATSGAYERYLIVDGVRYSHILNPKTGWPAADTGAATVCAATCLEAGMAATIAMLREADGSAWLQQAGYPHIWITPSGKVEHWGFD